MNVLGIDYGRKKIGLSIGDESSFLASPYRVIKIGTPVESISFLEKVIEEEEVGKIVIGFSEGQMAEETKKFAVNLEKVFSLPVIFQDEALSTREAQKLSIESGMKRRKRKKMEDAFAASIILQNYLDLAKNR